MTDTVDRPLAADTDAIRIRLLGGGEGGRRPVEDVIPVEGPLILAELRERAIALHPDADRFGDILHTCSTAARHP